MLMTLFARHNQGDIPRSQPRQDPLDHPVIQRMSQRELADLPPFNR